MPHDMKGNLLAKGDYVLVPCVITDIQMGDEYCNVSLQTSEYMYPGKYKSNLCLNAKQVVVGVVEGVNYGDSEAEPAIPTSSN